MRRYIWIQNRRYYLYDTYDTWRKAYEIGRYYKRRNGSRYFIVKTEAGFVFPEQVFALYMDKVMRL